MPRMNCYLAGPLFSQQDREMLERIAQYLESRNIEVYLPHRDGGDLGTVIFDPNRDYSRDRIFSSDIEHVKNSDLVVCLLDGQDSDSGTCVEIGFAYALGKPIFGLKTDLERRGMVLNNMVWGACFSGKRVFTDLDSLLASVNQFASKEEANE